MAEPASAAHRPLDDLRQIGRRHFFEMGHLAAQDLVDAHVQIVGRQAVDQQQGQQHPHDPGHAEHHRQAERAGLADRR
jgi:hypothetical protein